VSLSVAGRALCGAACQQKIGPQLKYKLKYKRCRRQYGYVLGRENVMWRLVAETQFRQIKQWSKVPFPVVDDDDDDDDAELRCEMRSKADMSQLNLPHGTNI